MGISWREGGREGGREGALFPNRESVNRTLMRVIPRADQDRIVFEGWRGNHVREGSLSRGRIDAELGGRAAPAEWRAFRIGANCAHFSSLTGENTEAMFGAGKSKS